MTRTTRPVLRLPARPLALTREASPERTTRLALSTQTMGICHESPLSRGEAVSPNSKIDTMHDN